MRLLLVEDDRQLSAELAGQLQARGFAVDQVFDGNEAAFMGENEPYDIMVLDLGLPEKPGLEVLRHWRARQIDAPVLILTARDTWNEKVEGFRAGADDYLTKPFHFEELLVRLEALIRRTKGSTSSVIQAGNLKLDEATQTVERRIGNRTETLELTGMEFRLLRYLMLQPGHVFSESHLLEHVYDYDAEKESNVIEVFISRLRKKLGKDCIRTRRGQGYSFVPDGDPDGT
ncbi:MAG TPA: response regulator transcription factor [Mariprofundaceae bacterium]|nr:response regulator transcription factor [Mariprofundaceae bacterium]